MLSFTNVSGVRIFLLQGVNEAMGRFLIEKQLHDGGIDTSFRSRSAAKARQARMSSRVEIEEAVRQISTEQVRTESHALAFACGGGSVGYDEEPFPS